MHKNKKTAKHPCTVCSKTFLSYHSLSAHQRTHNFHPFKCEECNTGEAYFIGFNVVLCLGLRTVTRASIDELVIAGTRVHFNGSITPSILYYRPRSEMFM